MIVHTIPIQFLQQTVNLYHKINLVRDCPKRSKIMNVRTICVFTPSCSDRGGGGAGRAVALPLF